MCQKKTLASGQIIFPIDRVVQKEFRVLLGGNKFIENALYNRQIPEFGFNYNNAHVGSYTGNPFNWAHVKTQKVSLFSDGQILNARPLIVDFERRNVMAGYWSLA